MELVLPQEIGLAHGFVAQRMVVGKPRLRNRQATQRRAPLNREKHSSAGSHGIQQNTCSLAPRNEIASK
jgi:hypothetical protein